MTVDDIRTRLRDIEEDVAELAKDVATIDSLHEILAQDPMSSDNELRADALQILSDILIRRDAVVDAYETAKQAFGLMHDSTNELLRAKVTYILGVILIRKREYLAAREQLLNAKPIFERFNHTQRIARTINALGLLHFNQREYDAALPYFESSAAIFETSGDTKGEMRTLKNVALTLMYSGHSGRALESFQRLYDVAVQSGDISFQAETLMLKGECYARTNDFINALDAQGKALQIYEMQKDFDGVAEVTMLIGIIYRSLEDYNTALEYSLSALKHYEEQNSVVRIMNANGEVGYTYGKLGNYPSALEYLQRALSCAEDLNDKFSIAVHLGNIGEAYKNLLDYEKARECYFRAIAAAEESGFKESAAYDRCSVAMLYADERYEGYDPTLAEEYVLSAISLYEETGARLEKDRCYKVLAELYKKQERWKEYATALEQLYELKEEKQNEAVRKKAEQFDLERKSIDRDNQLAIERAQAQVTEQMLHRVLPPSIAARLIKGEKVADYFDRISILFADIVGFTAIAAEIPPDVVIDLLNFVFEHFDESVAKHGCEKAKTIGDGYMAISGAPLPCEDHAERLARVALDMQKDILLPDEIREYLPQGIYFGVRVGIHCGSAVCGIMGKERFVWDVYSDAVNTAARMESSGESGKIHVSKEFAWLLRSRQKLTKSVEEFNLIERGEIEIKGKGTMRTYFLEASAL